MCARLFTFIFEGTDTEGVDGPGAARDGEDCAGEDEDGTARGCAKLEAVLLGIGACECPLKRGLGGSRSMGFGASSPLTGAFEFGCEGVCEADAACGVLAGTASVIGISIGAEGVLCTLPASVCIGPTGADL
jgi:hypothetical protein